VPTALPAIRPCLLLELRLLELHLLVLGAVVPEVLELLHGHRARRRAQVLLEGDDGVLLLGHDGPFRLGVLLASKFSQ
jgi:hypothetical protein